MQDNFLKKTPTNPPKTPTVGEDTYKGLFCKGVLLWSNLITFFKTCKQGKALSVKFLKEQRGRCLPCKEIRKMLRHTFPQLRKREDG